jgi:phosphatidylethanolamine/phosphatidyl-N-methylethanolamine N-methyltransferase
MAARPHRTRPAEHRVAFLHDFLRRPREVGSVIPSSRFLERRIVRAADLAEARSVVELGPGTGGTSRALLSAMRADARLLVIEINPRFVELIARSLSDPRLVVQRGDASQLGAILRAHALPAPEVVVSGIPFSTMPREAGLRVLRAVHEALAPGGRLVAYQMRDRVEALGRQVLGKPRVQVELLNVPPMRVYCWRKGGAA